MPFIRGTYIDGKIVLDAPAEWPEGTRVEVSLEYDTSKGMRDEDWPTTPEGIEALVRRMDLREVPEGEPFDLGSDPEWDRRVKEYSLEKEARNLDGMFP